MNIEQAVEGKLTTETEAIGETCLNATLSTKKLTRPHLELIPGRCGGNPATNRLSYGTAH
jgi:hypothetical protein